MKRQLPQYLFSFFVFLWSLNTWSYLSILESGEPVRKKNLHLGFSPQFTTGHNSGNNGVFFLRTGLDSGRDFTVQLGGGLVDFWSTVATRWVPIPDYHNQPAIGLRFDATLSRMYHNNVGILRLAPFISKRFQTNVGHIEPYAYLPLGLKIQEGRYDNLSSLVIGSKVQVEDLRPVYFYVESGFNSRNSLSYFSLGIFSAFSK
jgi:hypothetical protein